MLLQKGPKGKGFYPVRMIEGVEEPLSLFRFKDQKPCQDLCDSLNRAQKKHDDRQHQETAFNFPEYL
jgi:hypothetical protein